MTDTLGIDDHGINQDAWQGLQEAQSAGFADRVNYIESIDARDYEKNIAYFAERGYDLIFTSGVSLQDETLHAADLYPDSVFTGINQAFKESRPNLISITFPEDQMGFAAGALAAGLTKTGVIAGVCETSGIDSMWRYCEGFRAGAIFLNPNVKILVTYRDHGDSDKLFVDETWGHDTAISSIRRGADVVFAAGGVTGQGALKAATESGVLSIGTERDQATVLGESGRSVVTSFYGAGRFEVQEVMRLVKQGMKSGIYVGQFQYIAFSPIYPQNLTIQMDLLLKALTGGEIRTNVSPSSR